MIINLVLLTQGILSTSLSSFHYLLTGDRLSGWVKVFSAPFGSKHSGSNGLIAHLRSLFVTFGVPESLSSDGGPEFVASNTSHFLESWGVKHRISSAYFPQSNGRAEVAVKEVKRFLLSCIGPSGSLDNDKFLRGILQLRNTPDKDCKVSPAQIIFGKPLRDAFSFVNREIKFTNPAISPLWRGAWNAKEEALKSRFVKSVEQLNAHANKLPELSVGNRVFVQNQSGPHPNKWDNSGVGVECKNFDQYLVKIDGSGRVTLGNRRFLRHYTLPSLKQQWTPMVPTEGPLESTPVGLISAVPQTHSLRPLQDPAESITPLTHQEDPDTPR